MLAGVDRIGLERHFEPVLLCMARYHVVAGLARFIADMRSVYVDAAAERAILKEGYAMINRPRQADLVAQWVLIGFIHGVMNTDNMSIVGETIDYGPCAFMDSFHPETVFSSIDHFGRYAYGNQPHIAQWNLTRFAETLLPLLAEDTGNAIAAARWAESARRAG